MENRPASKITSHHGKKSKSTVKSDLQPYKIRLAGRSFLADRGLLAVPENRKVASSRLITIPFLRIHSSGESPAEPVFHLAGGPGLSNLTFKPPVEFLEKHDIVLVGYRGVDGPANLDCSEVRKAMKGVGGCLFSQASQAAMGRAIQECARRLQASGFDLSAYTIPEVIADLEAVRQALGYDRIHLLSQSYGTRIAILYAQQHPDAISRSVMIGVNPPGHFVWEAQKIDEQLAQYGRLYSADPLFGGRQVDLVETMRSINENLPHRWLFLPVDPGKVKNVSFALLFNRSTAALVFDAYRAAAEGDPSGLALMSLLYNFVLPGMFNWGDFLAKGLTSDYLPGQDYGRLDAPGTVMGSPSSQLFWPHAHLWPAPTIPESYRQIHSSAVETLLISGSRDFSTPPEFATQELLPFLTKGHQVILAELGHTADVWGFDPPAVRKLIAGFFTTGLLDHSLVSYYPMNFQVGWKSFPRIAKIMLAGAVIACGFVLWAGIKIAQLLIQ